MLFSSMTFLWLFLPITCLFYFLTRGKARNYILLITSLFFYSWGEPKYILLMLFSILINYLFGLLMDKCHKSGRSLLLVITVCANLGLLGYFKYYNFLSENINKLLGANTIPAKDILLPIGISFYTFQIMSYVIDLYRKEIQVQKNILDLALYISFFPQLIAGPIVKYKDINEQLACRTHSLEKFAEGIRRFAYGLGKKVIISNTMALVADTAFDAAASDISTAFAWFAALCYMFQIYYDFSGYSDMAIGLAKMFGFELKENFNYPYVAQSISEFWRRWHISLSTWFKEYLYIPLGGNRKGTLRTYVNLIIVFFTTGLWHGASWNFIFWGLYHGFFQILERIGLHSLLKKNPIKLLNHLYATAVVFFGWIFFRAWGLKNALIYIKVMFVPQTASTIYLGNILTTKTFLILLLAILLCGPVQCLLRNMKYYPKLVSLYKYVEPVLLFFIVFCCIMMLVSNTYNPFIYFRF